MSDDFHRAKLSAVERNFRSEVARLTLNRCTRGELHKSLYLVQSQGGKLRQICVPKAWQERIRRAVDDYRKMQELIEEVSELEWKRLKERKR